MSTLFATALNEPLSSLFSPSSSFISLYNALSRIIGTVPTPAPDLEASTASLITEVCSRGHSPFVADYTLEICADPNLSSTDIRHVPVMQGDACQAWVMATAASIINELSGVMAGGSMIANPSLVSKLSTKLAGVRTANDAIRSGGLGFQGVPADQLLQCQQLLAALSWISSQGTSCGHVPDLGRLRQATEARGNALQDAALEDDSTLSQVQQALPADSRGVQEYPFASLLACLKSMFLSDPHGPEVESARTTARARMVLYYFWDSGIQCGWRGLAEALGVEHQQAQWWHAIFLLEGALGDLQLDGAAQRAAGHSEVAVANATLELCMCQDVDLLLYAAQLLVALGETVAAERVVQQCCHGSLRPADHSLSTFERIIWTLLDLDDLHGALAQIRRFVGVPQWTPDANGLLYFLGNWAQEDDDKRRRFLELPFTKKEEEHFEVAFPDLHAQLLRQSTPAHDVWRTHVDTMKPQSFDNSSPARSSEAPQAANRAAGGATGAMHASGGMMQPAGLMFDTESLSTRHTTAVAAQRPLAALFQPDAADRKRRRRS